MCTLSWTRTSRFRAILFNRDEAYGRKLEEPPQVHQSEQGHQFLAPVDSEAGGTWIAANEVGLVAAVMNYYAAGITVPTDATSRGKLPIQAMNFHTFAEAQRWMTESLDPSSFNPFILLLFGSDGEIHSGKWDGNSLEFDSIENSGQPISTSSFEPKRVESERKDLYGNLTGQTPLLNELLEFHSHHNSEVPEVGPAMVRSDAFTRSLVVARISPTDVSLRHQFFDPQQRSFLKPTEILLQRRILS